MIHLNSTEESLLQTDLDVKDFALLRDFDRLRRSFSRRVAAGALHDVLLSFAKKHRDVALLRVDFDILVDRNQVLHSLRIEFHNGVVYENETIGEPADCTEEGTAFCAVWKPDVEGSTKDLEAVLDDFAPHIYDSYQSRPSTEAGKTAARYELRVHPGGHSSGGFVSR